LYQARRPRLSLRDKIKADIDLLGSLPEGTGAKAELLEDIEQNIRRLVAGEERPGVDWAGILIGAIVAGTFGWLTWWCIDMGGSYPILMVAFLPAALAGVFLLLRSWRIVYRYDDGSPVLGTDGRATRPPGFQRFGSFKRGVERFLEDNDDARGAGNPTAHDAAAAGAATAPPGTDASAAAGAPGT